MEGCTSLCSLTFITIMTNKLIHFLTTLLIVITTVFSSGAQFRPVPSSDNTLTFESIAAQAAAYFGEDALSEDTPMRDNDLLRYKRWEWYWKTRIMPDGSFPDLVQQKRIYDMLQQNARSSRDADSPWVNINQTYGDGGYNGMGRATAIAFHPTDPDIFYVGAPIGGIWKTTDGGLTYSALGDSLPYVSTGNICIDYDNPDNIYITVGDHNGWWNYGLGVFKSTDGGVTWSETSNYSPFTEGVAYLRMVMNPLNPLELFVAQTNGLYRTQDGGETWELVHNGSHIDVAYRPGSGTTLYCATDDYWGNSEVYRSEDNGATWTQVSDFGVTGNYLQITVTPANPDFLGVQSSVDDDVDFYASTNGGLFLNYMSNMPESGVVFASPTDENVIYCGFVVTYASYDGGLTWDQITDWYNSGDYVEVHADNRFVSYNPINNHIYFCNDGGIYRYREDIGYWTEFTAGLIITQYYRIAVSQQSPIFMIGGTQDNGGRKRIANGVWDATNGGDAMEVAINAEDDEVIYSTYIYGQLYRSYDQWTSDVYQEITPPDAASGAWVTPYVLDPSNQSIIVAGYEDVYRSANDGDDWEAISNNLTGNPANKLGAIAVAATNGDVIYTSRNNRLYATFDGGDSWSNEIVFGNISGAEVSSITVHPFDHMKIWVTVSGYADGIKVLYSENGGENFENVSFNLPNVPCNASVIDRESPQLDLYVGTDAGVFVLDAINETWVYYGSGLPNTSVTDLEIQYSSRKLRIGTYGRGIWENDLLSEPGVGVSQLTEHGGLALRINQNPVEDFLILDVHTPTSVQGDLMIYQSNGAIVQHISKTFPAGSYQEIIDLESVAPGNYILSFEDRKNNRSAMHFVVK
jgi:photosystem II stability/assembly factor-like uncharacterized protein